MSRLNTLYHGSAEDAADLLEADGECHDSDAQLDDVRIALINALRRIEDLEQRIAALTRGAP